jgi:hypothetical protein
MTKTSLLFLLFIFCSTGSTVALVNINDRIVKRTEEEIKHPDRTYLCVKKEELCYLLEELNKIISSLKDVQKLRYLSNDQQLLFVIAHIKLDNLSNALNYIDFKLRAEALDSLPRVKLEMNNLQSGIRFSTFMKEHLHNINILNHNA